MNRLTYRNGNNGVNIAPGATRIEVIYRLADYEDTGCTPVEIRNMKNYENAYKQGLLIKLPCKIGTTVYYIDYDCSNYLGDDDYCETIDICEHCKYGVPEIREDHFDLDILAQSQDGDEELRVPFYFTRKEAEEKLKELEAKNGQTD